jgi:hypothetical protein
LFFLSAVRKERLTTIQSRRHDSGSGAPSTSFNEANSHFK